ncbi:hypothetical protein KJI95_01725 [Shewanella sp. JM162201]|uniref:Uncharacterized protein n=1 Tax=Shewanella jiangmenensis TaxID=2837387 RepID=A0ABS5UYP2_9GAMM|nr:hypothetical protein [Shewanella jiangmenensis]MBT1443247.1 hypothetical protein [Shewanella jiangmenensis]
MLNMKSAFILALFTSVAAQAADTEPMPVQTIDTEGLHATISAELQTSNDELLVKIRADNQDLLLLAGKEAADTETVTQAE